MMRYYADSSFLVSCYITDANTAQANTWLATVGAPLPFTALHALEVRNAFSLGVFRGLFPPAAASAAWSNVEKDLRGGRLVRSEIDWSLALRMAARMSSRHSAIMGTRSLDILHVAAGRMLHAAEFITFDTRQRKLAGAVGFTTAP